MSTKALFVNFVSLTFSNALMSPQFYIQISETEKIPGWTDSEQLGSW